MLSYPRKRSSRRGLSMQSLLRFARNDVVTTEYVLAIPRRDAPEVFKNHSPRNKEGAGNAGCALHPRSRVQRSGGDAHEHTGQRRASDIPCAMVLRLMPSSPRRRIRFASVAGGLKDCSDPVGSTHLRRLDTSNGCQDHTVLPYAASRLRLEASPGTPVSHSGSSGHRRRSSARCVRSRTISPPCDHHTRPTLPRPPQPVPRS